MLDLIEARAAEIASSARPRPSPRAPRGLERGLGRGSGAPRSTGAASSAVRQYFEMEIALDARSARARLARRDRRSRASGPAETTGASVRGRPARRSREHHLYEPREYDEWRLYFSSTRLTADPTLWWLAWDGDDLAGFVIPVETDRGAVIDDLAVRKPWRGRGVAHGAAAGGVRGAAGSGPDGGEALRRRAERDQCRPRLRGRRHARLPPVRCAWRSRSPDGRQAVVRPVASLPRERAGAALRRPGPRRSRQGSVPGASVARVSWRRRSPCGRSACCARPSRR